MPLELEDASRRALVTDLSTTGMRIRCSRPLSGTVSVHLGDADNEVRLQAEVRWIRRMGLRRYEMGLRFTSVQPDQAQTLTRIAINNRPRRTVSMDPRGKADPHQWALYAQLRGLSIGLSLL